MSFTVRQAAEELGYRRYTATFEEGGDADREMVLTKKLSGEIPGNRAFFEAEDGRVIEIARLFYIN